jgi:hypothetical protein
MTGKTKTPDTEAAPGNYSTSKQRFSSLFKVASKLSVKSPHNQDTKEPSEPQPRLIVTHFQGCHGPYLTHPASSATEWCTSVIDFLSELMPPV